MKKIIACLLLILLIMPCVLMPIKVDAASMSLASIFKDNMVIQRDKQICIYGTGNGYGRITLGDVTKEVNSTSGSWKVYFEPMKATTTPINFSYDLSGNSGSLSNVVVGDVYVASGQSNMALTLADTDQKIAAAKGSANLRYNSYDTWQTFTADNVKNFSAIGVMFAQELEAKLNKDIPIGIISAALGSTGIEEWTSEEYCVCDKYHNDAHNDTYGVGRGPHKLYEKQIASITNFPVAGVLWYQGESNTRQGEAEHYFDAFKNMVKNWRDAWGDPDLPFYTVQIMLFGGDNMKDENGNARDEYNIRIAQGEAARSIKNVTVCTMLSYDDTAKGFGYLNIHPTNKKPVAVALANAALSTYYNPKGDYGKTPEYSGPLYKNVKVSGNTAEITFSHASGLKLTSGEAVKELEIRTGGGRWIGVEGELIGNKVVVKTDQADKITGVRMGYRNQPTINLYNGAGYCASPFIWVDKNAKIEHLPVKNWSSNSTYHWKNCDAEGCEEKFEETEHFGGSAASCKERPNCEVCNKKYGKFGPHQKTEIKNVSDTYTGDTVCVDCSAVLKEGTEIKQSAPGNDQNEEKREDSPVLWIILGSLLVLASGAVAVFFIIKRKKAKEQQKAE